MKRAFRIVAVAALVALLAAAIAVQTLRSSLPQSAGVLLAPGLMQPVEILRDRDGVAHIYARSLLDANYALGFAHAQDRLWQMELNRRTAAGRLSEIFGAATVNTDKFIRTLGLYSRAEETVANLDEETRAVFQAYANGVNAFLATNDKPLPPEFVLLRHRPEPWRVADSLAWIKMMCWDLSANWRSELLRMRLAGRLSAARIAQFLPPYPGDPPVEIRDLSALYAGLGAVAEMIAAAAPEPLPEGAGSNNWVVAGSRSVTGKPLLANDPHLGLTTPAVWYFAHLDSPEGRLIGATLPAVPMVVLGRNEHIAWGFTNTGPDTQDLFIEKLDAGDPAFYIGPSGRMPFATHRETIRVRGQPDVILTVRASRHGPIISDVSDDVASAMPNGYAMAFSWTVLRADDLTARALVRMGRAADWHSFVAALRDFHSPQQNIVFADTNGAIGFIAPARVPLRRPDNDLKGLAPAPGWDSRYDWQGFLPFEELPRSFNPPRGAIATANDKIVPPGYPHWITSQWEAPFRARRIRELLDALPAHDIASFRAMQGDVRSGYAREMLPLLLAAPVSSNAARRATGLLAAWDGEMRPERPEPLLFNAWLRELTRLIYADELGDAFAKNWQERPLFMLNVLRGAGGADGWCDDLRTAEPETCAQLIARALEAALADLERRYGADFLRRRWADVHAAVSSHRPFSSTALAAWFELRAPFPGDTWTVNVGRMNIADDAEPFVTRHAASLRAIYDLANLDGSLFMHSTGQSGNVFSPFYANFNARWARAEYLPMTMRRDEIERRAWGLLRLIPATRTAGRALPGS